MNAKQFVQENSDIITKIKELEARRDEARKQIPEATEDNWQEVDRLARIAEELHWDYAKEWEKLHQEIEAAVMNIPYRKSREATRKAIIREAGLN